MEERINLDPLTRAIIRLFEEERFYAELIMQMDRFTSTDIPTAGVCIKDKIQLHINPDFFNSLSKKQRVAVLKHECQHILNDHIARSKELAPEVYTKKSKDDIVDSLISGAKHQVINIAADCAINGGIPDIPKGGMSPEQFNLPPGQTLEWYLAKLKNNEQLKELTHFDDHSLWGESDGEKEEVKEKIKNAVNKAAEKTKAAGKMTGDTELLIERLNHKPRDWKSDLRRFAAKSLAIRIEPSKKKRNRRYGIAYPGVVKEETLHIGVAIDTSGSMSDEALNQAMAEIGNIAKYALVTVVEADSEVKDSYVFDPKKTYRVKGRGGTAYQPAFDYFTNNTDVDGVIYIGDMDNYDHESLKKPKYPVMWAIVGNQHPPADWGSQTKIEIVRNNK